MPTVDERYRLWQYERASALWALADQAMTEMRTHSGAPDAPEMLPPKTMLAGAFSLLAQAEMSDTARGLRLRLLLEWGPDMVTGGKISLSTYINHVKAPRTSSLLDLPKMSMHAWTAFASLVHDAGLHDWHTRALRHEYQDTPMDVWQHRAGKCRNLRIVQDVLH